MLEAFARGEIIDVPATVPPAFSCGRPVDQPIQDSGAPELANDQKLPWVRPPKKGELAGINRYGTRYEADRIMSKRVTYNHSLF